MKLQRIGIAALLLVGFVLMELIVGTTVGFSVKVVNDKALVEGGSNPALLIWAAVSIPVLARTWIREMPCEVVGVPSWKRRFAAVVIDFFVATAVMAPFLGLVPLAIEASRTGTLVWAFERHYTVASDWYVVIPLTVIGMLALMLYFALPIVRDRQTIGCFLLRLKVTPGKSVLGGRFALPQALRRVVLAFIGLCSGPFIWLLGRGEDGTTWYDRMTNCRVDLIRYTE